MSKLTVIAKNARYFAIGLEFGHTPTALEIGKEADLAKRIISAAQAEELRADPWLTVIEGEADVAPSEQAQALQAANAEIEALRAKLAKAEAEIAKFAELKKHAAK